MSQDAAQDFLRRGFFLLHGVLPPNLIIEALAAYEDEVLTCNAPLPRLDGIVEPHKFSPDGHMLNGLLTPHNRVRLAALPRFSQACLSILISEKLREAISQSTGKRLGLLAQSMVIGHSRGPLLHQDSLYIDSEPTGHVVIALIALDDIDEETGPFCIIPQDNCPPLPAQGPAEIGSEAYLAMMKGFLARYSDRLYAPRLKAGDALILKAQTLQGSLPPRNRRRRTLALVGHYVTEGHSLSSPPGTLHDESEAEDIAGLLVNMD